MDIPQFDAEVDARHRRIDAANWADIYVVGDVHGCRGALERLLDRIEPTREELVIFVGDLVRKGPDSEGTLDLVRAHPNALSVRGNNEQKLLDGDATLPSLTDDDLAFLESLPVAISWEDSLVVHGGVDHRRPMRDHSRSDLLTMRSLASEGGYRRPYWFEARRCEPRVFFGHTVLSEPFATDWAVGLDTGCVYGGELTAYRCSTGEVLTVEPERTYRDRSTDDVVDPRPTGDARS